MSNIIGFLETAGRDATMRHASREELLQRMREADIGSKYQDAMLQPQRAALNALLGAREVMFCPNTGIKPPKKVPAKAPPKKAPAKKPAKKAPAKRGGKK